MQDAKGKKQETGSEQRVGHVLGHASRILHLAGCDSPQLDGELLLAHVLGWDRARLLAHPERALTAAEWEQFTPLLARRQAREPLAYILGRREFYGLDFLVDRRVWFPGRRRSCWWIIRSIGPESEWVKEGQELRHARYGRTHLPFGIAIATPIPWRLATVH